MSSPASTETVLKVLQKVLPEARLNRIPRHPEHRNIVLAIICTGMRRRYPYSENEVNDLLQEQLDLMSAAVDHVTCRRYLVDFGFIKRDRAGTRYFMDFPKVESTLSNEAMESTSELVKEAMKIRRRSTRASK